jgi:malonyl-CoA decarboxylase
MVSRLWEKIKRAARMTLTGKIDPFLTGEDKRHIKSVMRQCILAKGGEISSRARAVELGQMYLNLNEDGRKRFMKILSWEYDIDHQQLDRVIEKYRSATNAEKRIKAEMELSTALIPPRVRLLKQFNSLPDGFKFLIDFRGDLLRMKDDPHLVKLDKDLKDLLSSWFDIGLLDLREITWESSASLLEKLMKYEAVHEIRSWNDLKNRLDSDRRCFAFFHSKMPNEPLIFVEVALVSEISGNIRKLLDEDAVTIKPEKADAAVFYSISNAQRGLDGIHLGNFLIKRVVTELSKKLKGLKHFVTLSPIPDFRKWFEPLILIEGENILKPGEMLSLKPVLGKGNVSRGLLRLLDGEWYLSPELAGILKPILMRLCAHYLVNAKKGSRALDPVANFHLRNGAHIERLNWLGDTSVKGLSQSFGMMVNYYYQLMEIEKNHEFYIAESRINISKGIKKLLVENAG